MDLNSADNRAADLSSLIVSIASSPIAAVITDPCSPDNPIVAANRAFCELTGYSTEEIVGRNCRFLAGPETEPEAQGALRRAIAEERPILVELLNYKKDGTQFRNALMIAPVLGPDSSVAYFLGSQMDVTATARLTTPRQKRAEDLVRTLTPRQRQVMEGMIGGYRNKQIAATLGIDEKTVKMHRAGLLAKLGVPTSADAIRIGVEAGVHITDRG